MLLKRFFSNYSRLFFPPILMLMPACGQMNHEAGDESALTVVDNGGGKTKKVKILSCHDGDTCNGLPEGETKAIHIRLVGIDCPEVAPPVGHTGPGQPLGKEAGAFTNGLVAGKTVELRTITQDMYGRTIGEIYLGKKLINTEILKAGFAEFFGGSSIDKEVYLKAQDAAQKEKLGIWALKKFEDPKDYRKAYRDGTRD